MLKLLEKYLWSTNLPIMDNNVGKKEASVEILIRRRKNYGVKFQIFGARKMIGIYLNARNTFFSTTFTFYIIWSVP